jgi:hypothetical protein
VQKVLARLEECDLRRPPQDPNSVLDSLCERVALHLGITTNQVRGASLRASALDARAMISHVAVCRFGLSLTAVGRHLNVSRPSIARALRRAEGVFADHGCSPDDFLDN